MSYQQALQESGLTQAQVDQYAADGFLRVENFFTADELAAYGKAVDAGVAYRTSDDHRAMGEKNLYEQTFVQCMRLWEDRDDVRPFVFHQKLCAAAAALLQTDRVRLWHDQALYKEPGGRQTDAHLDYPFWPINKPEAVSVWIPFQDVAADGGRMSYVQGSHISGITDFADIGHLHGGDKFNLLDDERVAAMPLIGVDAPLGSAIFHHACTIHCADANNTDATRRVFTMAYMADGLKRSRDEAYFALDRDEHKTGELVNGPGHPVAWPLETDALPLPPVERGPKTGFSFDMPD